MRRGDSDELEEACAFLNLKVTMHFETSGFLGFGICRSPSHSSFELP